MGSEKSDPIFCYKAVKRTPCLHGRTLDGKGNRARCARCSYKAVERTPCLHGRTLDGKGNRARCARCSYGKKAIGIDRARWKEEKWEKYLIIVNRNLIHETISR